MPRRHRNVVSLRGGAIPAPHVNPEIVDDAGLLVSRARDGQIAGLIYAEVSPQGHITTGFVGAAERHSMIAAAAILHHKILSRGG